MRETRTDGKVTRLGYVHEALFSANIAYVTVFAVFMAAPGVLVPLGHMEVTINRFFHIRQTDLVRGYWEVAVPSLIVTLIIWILLRISSRARFTRQLLRSAAGVGVILFPAMFWFYSRPYGWRLIGTVAETSVAVGCIVLYLRGKAKRFGSLAGALLLAAHYVFWLAIFGNLRDFPPHPGTITPLLGFPSALAWATFHNRSPRGYS